MGLVTQSALAAQTWHHEDTSAHRIDVPSYIAAGSLSKPCTPGEHQNSC